MTPKEVVRKGGYPLPYLKAQRFPIDLMQYGNVTPKTAESVRQTIERLGGRCSLGTEASVTFEKDRLFKRARKGQPVFLS